MKLLDIINESQPSIRFTCKEMFDVYVSNFSWAKDYWKKWLSAPITKEKFMENWGYDSSDEKVIADVNKLFNRYIQSLNNLKLQRYNGNDKKWEDFSDAFAFVDRTKPGIIYVNCGLYDRDSRGTLVHEIQHVLYNIKPLNPNKQIGSLFVKQNTVKDTAKSFLINAGLSLLSPAIPLAKMAYDSMKPKQTKKNVIDLNKVSQNTGLDKNTLRTLYNNAKSELSGDVGYVCRSTEKMSNIMAIRSHFRLLPGEDITYEMLKPEIQKSNPHTDVYWLIACWALNGFQDINQLLDKLNKLAYQKTSTGNDTQYA